MASLITADQTINRILFACNHSRIGGDNVSMVEISKALIDKGIEPFAIIPEKGMITDKFDDVGIKYSIIDHRIIENTGKLDILRKTMRYIMAINKIKPDVLHANDIHCFRIISFVGKLLRIRTACHVRYKVTEDGVKYYLKSKPDFLIFNSNFMKQEFENAVKDHKSFNKHVLYNPFDEKNYYKPEHRSVMRKIWKTEDKFVIGIVGNIGREKGHCEFIEIANKLLSQYDDMVFVIVGDDLATDKSSLNKLKETIKTYGITDSVIFHGIERNIGNALSGMDLFLFPSHFESFGRVVIEALLASLPVVASRVGGLQEVLDGNPGARLVSLGNIDGFVQEIVKIRDLIIHNDINFIEAGKREAINSYSAREISERLLSIYSE